jgi:hypothetical protein
LIEPGLWVCVCEVGVVWVDVGVELGVVPGEPDVPGVEGGAGVEVLCGGVELVGDDGVDGPGALGTEGTGGVETGGVGTVGVGTVGVETGGVGTVGVGTVGVVTSSAEADGRAAIPTTTTSVVIAPTTTFRLGNTAGQSPPAALLGYVVGAATRGEAQRIACPAAVLRRFSTACLQAASVAARPESSGSLKYACMRTCHTSLENLGLYLPVPARP